MSARVVFDAVTGKPLAWLDHGGPVGAVAFSPDSRLVATATGICDRRTAAGTARAGQCRSGRGGDRVIRPRPLPAGAATPQQLTELLLGLAPPQDPRLAMAGARPIAHSSVTGRYSAGRPVARVTRPTTPGQALHAARILEVTSDGKAQPVQKIASRSSPPEKSAAAGGRRPGNRA